MNAYILSILGIVIAGVIIEVIIPSGSINKYIRGIYSIFVVAVIISPIINLISKKNEIKINYSDFEIDKELVEYIFEKRVDNTEKQIIQYFEEQGYLNIDINIEYSIENTEIEYNSCHVNLENLAITTDKQHINKYEFIKEVVQGYTNLTEEEISIYE